MLLPLKVMSALITALSKELFPVKVMPEPLHITVAKEVPVMLFPTMLAESPLKMTVPPFALKVVLYK